MNSKSAFGSYEKDQEITIWGVHPMFQTTPLQQHVLDQLDEHTYAPFTLSALASQFNLTVNEVREQLDQMWETGLFQQIDTMIEVS